MPSIRFLIGIELSGWLREASNLNDPDSASDFFLKAGGGHVSILSNASGDTSREQGFGLTFGCGYDFRLKETVSLSPFASFSYGETRSWNYTAITFGLGMTFP